MKKTYVKPEIVFESFTMTTSIAAGCTSIVDAPSSGQCGYPIEGVSGMVMFLSDMTGICTLIVDDDPTNGFCYHVPTEEMMLFNS